MALKSVVRRTKPSVNTNVFAGQAKQPTEKSDLGSSVSRIIAESKRYPERTAIRIEVRSESDLQIVMKLAKIKIED